MSSAYNVCCVYSYANHATSIIATNSMNPDIVCNLGYQKTWADEKADDDCNEWLEIVNAHSSLTEMGIATPQYLWLFFDVSHQYILEIWESETIL